MTGPHGARLRGFNLLDMFSTSVRWKEVFPMNDGLFVEKDFRLLSQLGFDFVRLPISYRYLSKGMYGQDIDESRFWMLDRAVDFGRQYGVHVSIAFHRAPGYCVTGSSYFDFPERNFLFESEKDQARLVRWWSALATHFKDVPSSLLSFDLLNEPANLEDEDFLRIFEPMMKAIWDVSPTREIHVEGAIRIASLENFTAEVLPPPLSVATKPNVITSVHVYSPMALTHFETPYIAMLPLEPPTWPFTARLKPGVERTLMGENAIAWDKQALRDLLAPFTDLVAAGHRVHVGEFGAYLNTPHTAFLGWVSDLLDVLCEANIGWAMWNFRGPFGVLDSGRKDVDYEEWNGHALDRKLLDILLAH